jgi:hypothetical protein
MITAVRLGGVVVNPAVMLVSCAFARAVSRFDAVASYYRFWKIFKEVLIKYRWR